jgi:hypothetical protein
MEQRQREELVRNSLDLLPEPLRESVCLCCEVGCTQRDAASILGIGHRTVGYRVKKGLEQLRRILEKKGITTESAFSLGAWITEIGPPPAPALQARLKAIEEHYHETGTFPDWALKKTAAGKAASVSARAGKGAWSGALLPAVAATTVLALAAGIGYGLWQPYQAPETADPQKKDSSEKRKKEDDKADAVPAGTLRIVREVPVVVGASLAAMVLRARFSAFGSSMVFDGKAIWKAGAQGLLRIDTKTGRVSEKRMRATVSSLAWDGKHFWALLAAGPRMADKKKSGNKALSWRLHALDPKTLGSTRSFDLPAEPREADKGLGGSISRSTLWSSLFARDDAVFISLPGSGVYRLDLAEGKWTRTDLPPPPRRFPAVSQDGSLWRLSPCATFSAWLEIVRHTRERTVRSYRAGVNGRIRTCGLAPAGQGRFWILGAGLKESRLYLVELPDAAKAAKRGERAGARP